MFNPDTDSQREEGLLVNGHKQVDFATLSTAVASLGFLSTRPGQSEVVLWKLLLIDCRTKAEI